MIIDAPILLGFQKAAPRTKSLLSLITDEIASNKYNQISVCAAYASYRGVVLARRLLSRSGSPQFRWLFGLDDYITDPQALTVAAGVHNSELRIVPVLKGRRFHAKAYLLDHSAKGTATLIVGSANLTEAALTKNCEGYILVRATTEENVNVLRTYWEQFWQLGQPATDDLISEYQERHRARKFHLTEVEQERTYTGAPSKSARLVRETLDSSKLAWIELGSNTGGGNQLDIVKDLARFIRLPANHDEGTTVYLPFNSPRGRRQFQITFTKGMWRFMSLQQGFARRLRPDLSKPSPYVLLISRQKDGARSLSIQRVNDTATERMIEESTRHGFVGYSVRGNSGRRFGWY